MKPPKIELNNKTFRLILSGALALLGLAFFIIAFRGISAIEKKSGEMVQLKAQSQAAQNQLNNLEVAKKEVQKYSYFKSVANSVIPSDKDQAEAVLQIYQLANESGITLQSVTFPTSTLGETAAQSATGTGSTTAALTQAKPVPGIPGLYSLGLTITPEAGTNLPASEQVTYAKMLDFLKRIENNRRTAQITQVQIQPASTSAGLSFVLIVNIFIKP
jgi:hypothetical protein